MNETTKTGLKEKLQVHGPTAIFVILATMVAYMARGATSISVTMVLFLMASAIVSGALVETTLRELIVDIRCLEPSPSEGPGAIRVDDYPLPIGCVTGLLFSIALFFMVRATPFFETASPESLFVMGVGIFVCAFIGILLAESHIIRIQISRISRARLEGSEPSGRWAYE